MSGSPVEFLRHSPVWDEIDGGTLVVACSGGADSVALLRVAHQLLYDSDFCARFITPPSLVAWHFDHRARQTSSDDAAFVQALATQLDVQFIVDAAQEDHTATKTPSFEAVARRERYAVLLELLAAPAQDAVIKQPARALTAHHLEDQAETVLHHLIRGTHLAGLRGISPVYKELVFRPWLKAPRGQIRDYLARLGQDFREDESNRDLQYTRNRLRHSVFPVLTELNAKATPHIARLANLARIAAAQLEERLQALPVEEYAKQEIDRWLPLLGWPQGSYHAFRLDAGWDDQELLTQFAIRQLSEKQGQLDYQACDLVSDWATQPGSVLKLQRSKLQLVHSLLLTITHFNDVKPDAPVVKLASGRNQQVGGLTVLLREAGVAREGLQLGHPEPWQHIRHWPDALAELTSLPPGRASWQCVLPTEISMPLTLRAWQPGDRIALPGGGSKKLQDVFTDAKLPTLFRAVWAVLVDANDEVLWVPGLADSAAMQAGKSDPAWLLSIRDNM